MSEILKDRLVILRNYDFGDSSIVVVSLTRRHGKLRFLAKGAKKGKSRFRGMLRTGNIGEIVYYNKTGRGLQLLKEIETSFALDTGAHDLDTLCIFQAGLEVMDRSTIAHEYDESLFDLLDLFISMLGRARDPWVLFFCLETRLLGITGFYPSFDSCGNCGKGLAGSSMNVNPSSGVVLCDDCSSGSMISVSAGSAELLGRMEKGGIMELLEARLDPDTRMEIGRLLHNLYLYHMEGYKLPNALNILKGVE